MRDPVLAIALLSAERHAAAAPRLHSHSSVRLMKFWNLVDVLYL